MTYHYKTKGTCARRISIELEGEVIRAVAFEGGCGGNLAGISRIVEGMNAREVMAKFSGTTCGLKDTSCPDQLSAALAAALAAAEG